MQFKKFPSWKRRNSNKEILINKVAVGKKILGGLMNLSIRISLLKKEIGNINFTQEQAKRTLTKNLTDIMLQSVSQPVSVEALNKNWGKIKAEVLEFANKSEERNNFVRTRIKAYEQQYSEIIGPAWESDIFEIIKDDAKKTVVAMEDCKQKIIESDKRIKEIRDIVERT